MQDHIFGTGHRRTQKHFVPLSYTKHAKKRMAQRNISKSDIWVAMRYGQKLHRTGIIFFFLGKNDIPEIMLKTLEGLEGITVLLDPNNTEVITVYRNRDALRNIKRKTKHALPNPYLERV